MCNKKTKNVEFQLLEVGLNIDLVWYRYNKAFRQYTLGLRQ